MIAKHCFSSAVILLLDICKNRAQAQLCLKAISRQPRLCMTETHGRTKKSPTTGSANEEAFCSIQTTNTCVTLQLIQVLELDTPRAIPDFRERIRSHVPFCWTLRQPHSRRQGPTSLSSEPAFYQEPDVAASVAVSSRLTYDLRLGLIACLNLQQIDYIAPFSVRP